MTATVKPWATTLTALCGALGILLAVLGAKYGIPAASLFGALAAFAGGLHSGLAMKRNGGAGS